MEKATFPKKYRNGRGSRVIEGRVIGCGEGGLSRANEVRRKREGEREGGRGGKVGGNEERL